MRIQVMVQIMEKVYSNYLTQINGTLWQREIYLKSHTLEITQVNE